MLLWLGRAYHRFLICYTTTNFYLTMTSLFSSHQPLCDIMFSNGLVLFKVDADSTLPISMLILFIVLVLFQMSIWKILRHIRGWCLVLIGDHERGFNKNIVSFRTNAVDWRRFESIRHFGFWSYLSDPSGCDVCLYCQIPTSYNSCRYDSWTINREKQIIYNKNYNIASF